MIRTQGKKIAVTVSTVLFLLTFSGWSVFAAVWTSGGPYGGDVESLSISSTNPDIIYAGTATGVFKTANGGDAWTMAGLIGISIRFVQVAPDNPDVVYAGTDDGIYKSVDGGVKWPHQRLPGVKVNAIAIEYTNANILYAGADAQTAGGAFFKSVDGGETWQEKIASYGGEIITDILIDTDDPSYVYFGAGATSGFYKSADRFETWEVLDMGTGISADVYALAMTPAGSNPSVIYAIVEGDDVYKSTNGGDNWTDTNVPHISEDGPWALATDPNSPEVIYVGTYKNDGSIYKSIDGGTSWTIKASGLPDGAGPSSIVIDPRNSDVYVGMYGGVYKSANGGESWQISGLSETTSITSLAAAPTEAGAAIGVIGFEVLAATSDGGVSWKILASSPDDLGAVAIDPQNSSTIWTGDRFNSCSYVDWGCYLGNSLYKTTNGGESWSQIPLRMHFCDAPSWQCYTGVNDLLIKADDSDSLLVSELQYQGYVYRTDDGGLNWRASGGYATALAADPNEPNVVYKGEPFVNAVYRSSDFGSSVTSWANISPTADSIEGVWDIEVDAASRVYVLAGGKLWRWDSGNWGKFVRLPNITALAIDRATSPGKVYFGTGGDGVYVSADGGNPWTYFGEGLEELYIRKLDISETSPKILYAGTNAGVWSRATSEGKDTDGDGLDDSVDNCPSTSNPDQNDADGDDIGDACDMSDTDGDGIADNSDTFPTDPAASVDSDGDGYPDAWNEGMSANDSTTGLTLDAFPLDADEMADTDGDGVGDNADLDDDDDGQSDGRELSCGADPKDPVSFCSASFPWLMLLLEDE
ncbi:thrombospondin type 3 repeat-containing protein [Thermodesulfobacteriota bacterium]